MTETQTQVHRGIEAVKRDPQFRTAVSLHSHTYHSKENLDFLPHYIEFHRIPFVTKLVQSELKQYESRTGKPVDFRRAYWTPPVTPEMVFRSEESQIRKLGLSALVSITDHDTIAAPLSLQQPLAPAFVPVSVEWSIPFAGNCFHVGVHGLPPAIADDVMKELAHFTAGPGNQRLSDLFSMLHQFPDVLLVLNHPCCNFVRVNAARHWDSLRAFMAGYRSWIHALELNGMRPWKENQDVLRMAQEYDLPVVAGGDRHGCRPNTMINLSRAQYWADFVAQIRDDHESHILVLPDYEEPVRLRELATAGDVLRRYPDYPYGRRRFTDRVFVDVEGYSWNPLSFYWDGGNGSPKWLPPVVAAVVAIGSDYVRPVLRKVFSLRGEYDTSGWPLRDHYGSEALETVMETTPQ